LIHEFTYQAMVYDLLEVQNHRYKYQAETLEGKSETKEVILGENDPLWITLRHKFIVDATQFITETFNDLLAGNNATKLLKGEKMNNISEQLKAVQAMPQFQEKYSKYSLHITIGTSLTSHHVDDGLDRVAQFEIAMATGEDDEGNPIKNGDKALEDLLVANDLSDENKLRALAIYLVAQGSTLKDKDRRRILSIIQFPKSLRSVLPNLNFLGVNFSEGPKKEKRDKKKDKKKKVDEQQANYDLARFSPNVKQIVNELIEGTLSKEAFPFKKEKESNDEGKKAQRKTTVLPSAKTRWWDKSKEKKKTAGGRVIVFVAGGITFSETRSAYELTEKHSRPVIVGSDWITVPKEFIQNLAELKKDANMDNF